ncbi:MAG: gliding motility-associated C-terminal domain-containing protein [Flavobacteriales bacterium]|nr:gliding motility-associated C-terminal domain-containing protein [Flavobacteriales bacterium]
MHISAKAQSTCNALNFDGINDYVNVNSLATPMAGKSIFTIEFWIKADFNDQSGPGSSLFAINNLPAPTGSNRILLMLGDPHAATQNGKLWIGNNLITPYLSNVVIGDNTCHHIAYAQNGNIGTIYIDGVFSGTLSSNIVLSASDLYSIGQEWDNTSTSDFYNGEIDDLRIWGEARTITQIQSNMNNELTGNEPNLIAYYNFNQGVAGANNSGINTLTDSSPNNISGTLNGFSLNGNVSNWILDNCTNCISTNNCHALYFDGVNDYVSLNSLAPILSNPSISSNFTVEFWMKSNKFTQTHNSVTLFAINTNSNFSDGLIISMGTQSSQSGQVSLSDDAGIYDFTTAEDIGDNICHHIAYIRSSTTGYLYIDGINVGSHFTTYSILSTDKVSIGQEWDFLTTTPTTSQFYNGEIDDLRIWGEARTITQIQSNMNNELTGNEPNLIAYYNFNQGVAGANNSGINTLTDSSPNNISGTLNGFSLNGNISNWILDNCTNCNSLNPCNISSNFNSINHCLNDTTYFTDLSVDSLDNIINWQWNFGDGSSSTGIQNPQHIYTNSGNFNVTLIITNDNNCMDSITIPISIHSTTNSIQNLSICQGDSVFFDGQFYNTSGIYTDSLQSSFGCDSVLTLNLNVISSLQTLLNQSICQGDSILLGGSFQYFAGVYTDSLQALAGCDSIVITTLTVNQIYHTNQNLSICAGDSILIDGTYQTSSGIYTDSLQTTSGCDSIITINLTVNPIFNINQNAAICQGDSILINGIYQTSAGIYTEILQSINGCDSTIITNLSVDSVIQLTISKDTTITPCNSVQLSVSGSNSYLWSPSLGLSCITCSNPIAHPSETTTYTIQTSNNTCVVNNSVTVFVEGDVTIFVPNVFTPNRDGQNDGFNIIGDCIETIHKIIYNRWGMVMFESTQINEVWDGTTSTGAEVPEGTYFYIFTVTQINKEKSVFKGSLTLLR